MQNPTLKNIKKKLLNSKYNVISTLSIDESKIYLSYRYKNLLLKNGVLTYRELEYLLCEVGQGKLRLDPGFINPILKYKTDLNSIKSFKTIFDQKRKLDKAITDNISSKATKNMVAELYRPYLRKINTNSINPFIISGDFNGIPITILTKNGEWVMPDTELLNFIKLAYEQKKLPIIIAKKIHGIIFPIFKEISVIGNNLYYSFVSTKIYNLVNDFNFKYKDSHFPKIKYNEKLINIETLSEPPYLLSDFFEIHLPNIIEAYSKNFLSREITRVKIFKGLVNKINNTKVRNYFNKWYKHRQMILNNISLN